MEQSEIKREIPQVSMNRSRFIFRFIFWGYVLFLVIVFTFHQYITDYPAWLLTSLIIGSGYVLISLNYFYEHFLAPSEREAGNVEKLGLIAKKGSIISIARPNIAAWLWQWFIPALLLLLFVVIGFRLTLLHNRFHGNIFSQPYVYGMLYKNLEAFNKSSEFKMQDLTSEKALKRAEIIEVEFSGYIKKYSPPDKKNAAEYIAYVKRTIELPIYNIPFYIALAFGFLGTLIYSLTDLAFRSNASDLYPNTLVGYLIRFVFAPSICIVLAFFMMNDWWVNAAPLISFFVGFFPHRALQYLEERARELLSLKKEENREEIPLGRIQGMTDYISYRFREIGIGDAQNLAFSDLSNLRTNLGFSDRQICDFVAQALLLVSVKDDFTKLQTFGIRNIIVFKNVVGQNNFASIAALLGIAEEKMKGLLVLVSAETMARRIETLEAIIKEADNREKMRRTAIFTPNLATS